MRSSILASGTAEMANVVTEPRREPTHSALREILSTLGQDKFAAASAIFLILVLFCALFGPALLGDQARAMNLMQRNAAPAFPEAHPQAALRHAVRLGQRHLSAAQIFKRAQ